MESERKALYNHDPYGAAVSDIVEALQAASSHEGKMSEDEFETLSQVALALRVGDPHLEGLPIIMVHGKGAA